MPCIWKSNIAMTDGEAQKNIHTKQKFPKRFKKKYSKYETVSSKNKWGPYLTATVDIVL